MWTSKAKVIGSARAVEETRVRPTMTLAEKNRIRMCTPCRRSTQSTYQTMSGDLVRGNTYLRRLDGNGGALEKHRSVAVFRNVPILPESAHPLPSGCRVD